MRTLSPCNEEAAEKSGVPVEDFDPLGGVMQWTVTPGITTTGTGRGLQQIQGQSRTRQGSLARGSIQRSSQQRRRSSFIPPQAAHAESTSLMAPSVAGIQGAAVQLPNIQGENTEAPAKNSPVVSQQKMVLPTLPPTYQRPGPGNVRRRREDVQLVIDGQDLKLPPPRSATEPRNKPISLKEGLAVLEAATRGATDGAPTGMVRKVLRITDDLKKVLLCHSIGVPLQIKRPKGGGRAKLAMPLFHCERCMAHWNNHGKLPESCDHPAKTVRGEKVELSPFTSRFIRQLERIQLQTEGGHTKHLPGRELRKLQQLFQLVVTVPTCPPTTPDHGTSQQHGCTEDYSSAFDEDTSSDNVEIELKQHEEELQGQRKTDVGFVSSGRERRKGRCSRLHSTTPRDASYTSEDFSDDEYNTEDGDGTIYDDSAGMMRKAKHQGRKKRGRSHGKEKGEASREKHQQSDRGQDEDSLNESYSSVSSSNTDTENGIISDISEGQIDTLLSGLTADEQARYKSLNSEEKKKYRKTLVKKHRKTLRKKAKKRKDLLEEDSMKDSLDESYSSASIGNSDTEDGIFSDISEGQIEILLKGLTSDETVKYKSLNSKEGKKYRKALMKKYRKALSKNSRNMKRKKGTVTQDSRRDSPKNIFNQEYRGADYKDKANSDTYISETEIEKILNNMDAEEQKRYKRLDSAGKIKFREALVKQQRLAVRKKKGQKSKGSRKDATKEHPQNSRSHSTKYGEAGLSDEAGGRGSNFILAGRHQNNNGSYDALIDTLVDVMEHDVKLQDYVEEGGQQLSYIRLYPDEGQMATVPTQMSMGSNLQNSSDDQIQAHNFKDAMTTNLDATRGSVAENNVTKFLNLSEQIASIRLGKSEPNQLLGDEQKTSVPYNKPSQTKHSKERKQKSPEKKINSENKDVPQMRSNQKLNKTGPEPAKKTNEGEGGSSVMAGGKHGSVAPNGHGRSRKSSIFNPAQGLNDIPPQAADPTRNRKEQQKAPKLNPAVKNKTGKPETLAGHLKANVFSTAKEDLAPSANIQQVQEGPKEARINTSQRGSVDMGSRLKSASGGNPAKGTQVKTLVLDQPLGDFNNPTEGASTEVVMPGQGRRPSASIPNTRQVRQVIKKGPTGGERRRPQAKAYHSKGLESDEVPKEEHAEPVKEAVANNDREVEPIKKRVTSASLRLDPTITGPNMQQSIKMSHGEQKNPLQDTLPSTAEPPSTVQMTKTQPLPPINKVSPETVTSPVNKPVCAVEAVQVVEQRRSNEKQTEEEMASGDEEWESVRSQESSSSTEPESDPTEGLSSIPQFVLPAFGGMSVLAFSSATYSIFSLPEQYRKHNEQIKNQSQSPGNRPKQGKATGAKVENARPDKTKGKRSSLSGLSRQVTQKIKNHIATKNMLQELDTVIEEAASHGKMLTASVNNQNSATVKSSIRTKAPVKSTTTSATDEENQQESEEKPEGLGLSANQSRRLPSRFQGLHKAESIIIQVVDYPQLSLLDGEVESGEEEDEVS